MTNVKYEHDNMKEDDSEFCKNVTEHFNLGSEKFSNEIYFEFASKRNIEKPFEDGLFINQSTINCIEAFMIIHAIVHQTRFMISDLSQKDLDVIRKEMLMLTDTFVDRIKNKQAFPYGQLNEKEKLN